MKKRAEELEIKYEFDPVFETMGLLYGSRQEDTKEQIIQQLNELGTDGELFYKKYFRLIEEYTDHFMNHMINTSNLDFLFRKGDETFFCLMAAMLMENRHWLKPAEEVTDEEIRGMAGYFLLNDAEKTVPLSQAEFPELATEQQRMEFLAKQEMDDGLKWHLMEFMQSPAERIKELVELVRVNIPAFERALSEMEGAVKPFMEQYKKREDRSFWETAASCAPGATVYPAFATGASQMIFYTQVYCGVFTEFLLHKRGNFEERKPLLLTRLKALSDRSKLDILCQLKESSKYNLELAQSMELSPSTMSHHMNVLFACDLVGIEKKDGRVYYFLREEAVRECLEDLEGLLL